MRKRTIEFMISIIASLVADFIITDAAKINTMAMFSFGMQYLLIPVLVMLWLFFKWRMEDQKKAAEARLLKMETLVKFLLHRDDMNNLGSTGYASVFRETNNSDPDQFDAYVTTNFTEKERKVLADQGLFSTKHTAN